MSIRQNKEFRVLCWQVFNAVVAFWLSWLFSIEWEYQAIAVWLWVPVLNIITKYINNKWFNDLWVDKSLDTKE